MLCNDSAMTTAQQVSAGADPIVITADLVTDEHGRPTHTNLNFGGRFGHSAIYHRVFGGIDAARREISDRIEHERQWHERHGRATRVEVTERVNPFSAGERRR